MSKAPEDKVGKKIPPKKVGGFAFYLSFLGLFLLTIVNLITLPILFFELESLKRWTVFGICSILGALFCARYFTGKWSVYFHELKHKALSNIAGNRAKKLRVESSETGFFEYTYTKRTAHMNAMISLAPYVLPILTILCSLIVGLVSYIPSYLGVAIIGFGYGTDLLHCVREISPYQTDLSNIRGGYSVALAYIVAFHAALLTTLAAWVCAGSSGLEFILFAALELGKKLALR